MAQNCIQPAMMDQEPEEIAADASSPFKSPMSEITYQFNTVERFMARKGFERRAARLREENKENIPPVTPPRMPAAGTCTHRVYFDS